MTSKQVQVKVFKSLSETTKPEIVDIIGEIPEWASGRLLRSCAAKWDYPKFRLNHAVDGYTMITKFEVKGGTGGKVAFTSKFLQSEAFRKAEIAQKPILNEFSTRSAGSEGKSSIGKIVTSIIPDVTDNCKYICTSGLSRNPTVLGDNGFIFDLDAKTLNCVSRHDPVKEFGLQALSSHPLTDPETGETYNVGLDIVPSAKWKVVKFPAQCGKLALKETIKKGKIIAVHPCRAKLYAPWLHSFGMSKNYVVWIDQPCHFSVTKALKAALKGFCPREVMEWSPEKKNQFYLLNKKTLKVLKTEIISKDAIFFNHFLTCHEENGHVILDLFGMPGIQYCDVQVLAKLRSGKVMQDKDCPRLYRFVIPLIGEHDLAKYPQNKNLVRINSTAKAVRIGDKLILEPELMSEIAMDFATWNKKLFSGEQIRFIWTTGALCPSVHHHKVAKFDVKTRKFLTWEAEQDQHVGEPCLIPRSGAIEQDDGLIVLFVNNYLEELGNEKRKDFLIWLNAKDLKEVGRAYFYSEIPIALHSIWMSN